MAAIWDIFSVGLRNYPYLDTFRSKHVEYNIEEYKIKCSTIKETYKEKG